MADLQVMLNIDGLLLGVVVNRCYDRLLLRLIGLNLGHVVLGILVVVEVGLLVRLGLLSHRGCCCRSICCQVRRRGLLLALTL